MKADPDVLILGSGIAGLSAAITAAEQGLEVLVLTKASSFGDTNTALAQGGIVGPAPEDSAPLLAQDILSAGAGLGYQRAVEELSQKGPELVQSVLIDQCRVRFALDESGHPDLAQEGAHSVRRIHHWMDRSGQAIHDGLMARALKLPRVHMEAGKMAVDLLTSCHHSTDEQDRYRENRAIGAYVLDVESGEVEPVLAPLTVLATGGAGQVFRHSSNPAVATGDGIAMAYRAGLSIINAEYVQFHPTTLYHRDFPNFLISEAVRGEGAILVNRDGEAFMDRYHPKLKDLAPRDEVSRAIYQEMEKRGDSHVLLDATRMHVDPFKRFPAISDTCRRAGVDMSSEPIPVVPAAHYFCGGVKASLDGSTSLPGLYAIGETACTGVHGANRLASVSLLEGLYTGVRFGQEASGYREKVRQSHRYAVPDWVSPEIESDPAHIHNDLSSVQGLMWNYVGISRTRRRLQRALADLNYLNHRIDRFYREARPSRALVEMRNAALTASVIARSASTNGRSKGCHYLSS
ncbi:MAG: FAD-dependent oxidoreductase [Spirochaetales bacterium]|nr:FAD-dependent oxidoreductase [Spirochaetales bacterium]